MTVAEFQLLLSELGRFLRTLKAAGAAKEVEEVGAKLAAFKDYKLKAFGDLLAKAEEYARLGPRPKHRSRPGRRRQTRQQSTRRASASWSCTTKPSTEHHA